MRKRILSIILIAAMLISMAAIMPVTVVAEPYLGTPIASANDFQAMLPGGQYYLTANITVSSTYMLEYTGTFDGNGYTVTTSVPLFSTVSGIIKNLTVSGSISATTGDVGAVAVLAQSGAAFINVVNKASVTGTANAAGIVAAAEGSSLIIDKCINTKSIAGGSTNNHGIGGIIGFNKSKIAGLVITNCLNLGTISTSSTVYVAVGGIIGRNDGIKSTIKNCINKGNITGKWTIGGIIGFSAQSLKIEYCLNDATISGVGTSGYCGGIVSRIGTDTLSEDVYTIKNCVNKGYITSGKDQAAGIIAYSRRPAFFENCYNYGDITAPVRAAGIAGLIGDYYADFIRCFNYGDITNTTNTTTSTAAGIVAYGGGSASFTHQYTFEGCGNEGNIQAYHYVGGIVAYLYGGSQKTVSIQFCYNTGNLTSINSYVAGLLGYINNVENPICKYNYISGTLTATNKYTYATLYNNDPDPMTPSNLHHNYIKNGAVDYYRYKNDLGKVAFPSNYEYYFVAADLVNGELAADINLAARYVGFYQTLGTDTHPISDYSHKRVRHDGTNFYNDLKATFIKENSITYNGIKYDGVNEVFYIHREVNFVITIPEMEGVLYYSVAGAPSQTVIPNTDYLMVTDKVFYGNTNFVNNDNSAGIAFTTDAMGIRFYTSVNKTYCDDMYTKLNNTSGYVSFGIVIAPQSFVVEAGSFTMTALDSLVKTSTKYLNIPATSYYRVTSSAYNFAYTFTEFDEWEDEGDYRTLNIAAIGYVCVTDTNNGNKYYLYSDTYSVKNLQDMAQAAWDDILPIQTTRYYYSIESGNNAGKYSPYTDAQRAILFGIGVQSTYEFIKVMSYNIRNIEDGDRWDDEDLNFEYDNRNVQVLKAIKAENPDVLGLQEACTKKSKVIPANPSSLSWFDTLENNTDGLIKSGYSAYRGLSPQGAGSDKEMFNAIYYKTSKFNFIKGGTAMLPVTDGDTMCANWVVLETKEGGNKFLFISTHFQAHSSDANKAARIENAEKLLKFINTLKATDNYNYPVILLGDFNESNGGGGCKLILESGYADTLSLAKIKVNETSGTGNNDFTTLYSSKLDHIFTKDLPSNAYVSYYETVENKYITGSEGRYPSDHLPIVAYIEFPIPNS